MEIYLESKKTPKLMCKLIKKGSKTIILTVWNRYAYSELLNEPLFNSSEIDQVLDHAPIDKVHKRWVKNWDAIESTKESWLIEAKSAVLNTHDNLF